MITVSICMIVKNEEKFLKRCLDSIADLCEELIIVDTGSTDKTKEIAAKYNAKIYDYKWNDDFAEARNFSFSKATMEYIYQADADEVLDETNRQRFLQLKKTMLPQVDIVQMYYCNQLEYNTVYNCDREYRPKMYKRLRQFYFEDPIHEQVRLEPVVFDSDIEIMHKPGEAHASRDFLGFEKINNKNNRLSKRLHNMYATELLIAGEDKDFLNAKKYFEAAIEDSSRSMQEIRESAVILVKIARIECDVTGILKYTLRDMSEQTSSEMCYELGEFFYGIGDFEEAAMWYYNCIYETNPILYNKCKDVYAREKLADIYEKCGNYDGAKQLRLEITGELQ